MLELIDFVDNKDLLIALLLLSNIILAALLVVSRKIILSLENDLYATFPDKLTPKEKS